MTMNDPTPSFKITLFFATEYIIKITSMKY